jgi:hypothetical protein
LQEAKIKAAGLSGCCPDQDEDSALRQRDCLDWVAGASLLKRYSIKTIRTVKAKVGCESISDNRINQASSQSKAFLLAEETTSSS